MDRQEWLAERRAAVVAAHDAEAPAYDEHEISQAFESPGREKVLGWFGREDLTIIDEGFKRDNGWGYRHFLRRG